MCARPSISSVQYTLFHEAHILTLQHLDETSAYVHIITFQVQFGSSIKSMNEFRDVVMWLCSVLSHSTKILHTTEIGHDYFNLYIIFY
jgi:hypothetical protein